MSDKQLVALLSLLDDPDEKVFQSVRGKLLELGSSDIHPLLEMIDLMPEGVKHERFSRIIHDIYFNNTLNNLYHWRDTPEQNILQAIVCINKYLDTEIDEKVLQEKVEVLAKEIWLELNNNLTALEKIKVLNHLLFSVHQHKGKQHLDAIHLYYLSHLIQTLQGNPVSIGLLYLILSQYNDMPVYGVDLPGHFLLAYTQDPWVPEWSFEETNKVLFYINPFKNGAVFTSKEIDAYLEQMQMTKKAAYYLPCTNDKLIMRFLQEMQTAYEKNHKPEKAEDIRLLLTYLYAKQDV